MATQKDKPAADNRSKEDLNKIRRERTAAYRAKRNEEKKREKETGQKAKTNLGFIQYVYKKMGYNRVTFAAACGVNPQTIYWYELSDDCQLSKAIEMLASIGVKLGYIVEKDINTAAVRMNTIEISSEEENIRGFIPKTLIKEKRATAPLFARSISKNGRMKPLAEAIVEEGLTANDVAKMIDSDGSSMIHWFDVTDDIRISTLNKMAEALGYKIVWTVDKI